MMTLGGAVPGFSPDQQGEKAELIRMETPPIHMCLTHNTMMVMMMMMMMLLMMM